MKYQCLHCMLVHSAREHALRCCSEILALNDGLCEPCPIGGEDCEDVGCDECLGTGWVQKVEKEGEPE